jgi:3-deoxy-D-manno-octulosonic-acid transferase
MRLLYSLAWLLALPFAFLYLLWRSRRQPAYRRHWAERLGWAPRLDGRPVLWVHAVSVGETRAAAPVITALRDRYPDYLVLLTHATPTGRATGRELFGEGVRQAYLPYDFPPLVRLFLQRTRPQLGLIMETEVWPNLLRACRRRDIPVLLVNARLSERSARGYRRFAALTRMALQDLRAIAAQTEADAQRLRDLGAKAIIVTGNVKFDVTPPPDVAAKAAQLKTMFAGRFVFLCASTREGEEMLLLDALADLPADVLLVLVPRHPQRFAEVAELLRSRGLAWVRRSEGRPAGTDTRVCLGDSMGEMAAYYAAADLCYVGGSLLPLGGQNLIESAAAGCPALIGPHTWNFLEAAEQAVACGAARRVADAVELRTRMLELRADAKARQRMAKAGRDFARSNQGATARILVLIEKAIGKEGAPAAP